MKRRTMPTGLFVSRRPLPLPIAFPAPPFRCRLLLLSGRFLSLRRLRSSLRPFPLRLPLFQCLRLPRRPQHRHPRPLFLPPCLLPRQQRVCRLPP